MPKKEEYGNESITSLKGADRVRKRPGVIFGSDGVDGCAHSIFEILSNSIDEAREGHGDKIILTRYKDGSVQVEDFGRGMPVDYNKGEERYNWELLFCEMYAGGKYGEDENNYEFSLGLCATQYASEWMTADIYRDGYHYHLDFRKGENVGGLQKEPFKGRRTGSIIRWKPDTEVFTDIHVPLEYYRETMKRQAVVNAGLSLVLRDESGSEKTEETFCYQNGIVDYVEEIAGLDAMAKTLRQRVTLLERELRATAQRVNLFEKVKIPEAKENIRVIGIYLGDQQTSAVVRAKIAKKKLQEVGR